jgi:hypothetical protein
MCIEDVSKCVYITSLAQLTITGTTYYAYSVHVSNLKLLTVEQTIASAVLSY